MTKGLVYLCIFIGGIIGSYAPTWLGAGFFSITSIVGSVIGGLAGIWVAIKLDGRTLTLQ